MRMTTDREIDKLLLMNSIDVALDASSVHSELMTVIRDIACLLKISAT